MPNKPTINYEPLRIEYINSEISIRELAERHNISESALEAKAYRDDWSEQRKKIQEEVLLKANSMLAEKRATELAEWNDRDLQVAKALRAKAVAYLTDSKADLNPAQLRQLATTIEASQKIARLALGVSTNNSEITGKDGQPLLSSLELVFVE